MEKRLISLISTDNSLICHNIRGLSSFLKQRGHQTRLIFLNWLRHKYQHQTLVDLQKLVSGSDLIVISCYSQDSTKVEQVVETIKKLGIPIVWGGIHATLNPERCLEYADIVCIGEGEGAILDLADSLDDKDKIKIIKNLWVKENGNIYKNELRPLISNLDELPYEDYEFSDQYLIKRKGRLRRYRRDYLGDPNYQRILMKQGLIGFSVSLSRGCPFSCFFCPNYDFQKLYGANAEAMARRKSVKATIDELKYYQEEIDYRFDFISFDDDDFFVRPLSEMKEFCAAYKREIRIPFSCKTHVQSFDEEKLKLLMDAGIRIIDMGIYSICDKTEKEVHETDILNAKVIEASEILNRYLHVLFRPPVYHIINTNPHEPKEDVWKTINLIKSLPKPFIVQIGYPIFLSNSYLTNKPLSDGLLSEKEVEHSGKGYYGAFPYAEKRKFLRYDWLLLGLLKGSHESSKMGGISKSTFQLLTNKIIVWFFERNGFLVSLLRYFSFLHPPSPRFVLFTVFLRLKRRWELKRRRFV